jgi:hypothetical protein
MRVTPDMRLQPHPGAVLRRVGDGAVLVELGSGHVFELNDTAARIWELVVERGTVAETVEALLEEFTADKAGLMSDVVELVDTLTDRGLLLT